jgi:S1-C subfamily serine protease
MTSESSLLATVSDQLADAAATAARSVVSVHARPRLPSTGVHWRDGIVVTTEATVKRDHDLGVTLPDGRRVSATLVGRDPGTDLAAIRIETGLLPIATRGDATKLRPGHLVLALGRAGDQGIRAAFGAVSATGGRWRSWKGGEIDHWLQSDLTLYPGMGGGPLVEVSGLIVGLNSGGLSRPFATTIPAVTIDRVVTQLVDRGFVPRGWLGAAMQPVKLNESLQRRLGLASAAGLVILSIEPDAPAALAGLMVGDVLLAIDGQPVDRPEAVLERLAGDVVGKTMALDLVRGGARTRADVLIGERPRRKG